MLFYTEFQLLQGGFLGVDFNGDYEHEHEHEHDHDHENDDDHHRLQELQQQQQFAVKSVYENGNQMVDYLLNNPTQHVGNSGGFCSSNSLDKLSFADVMQFADLGPKLALNQNKTSQGHDEDQETRIDPVYFLKFPVLNERAQQDHESLLAPIGDDENEHRIVIEGGERDEEARVSEGVQYIGEDVHKTQTLVVDGKNKRKRPRTIKTSEEVESQRMTHIAVERNRRKQMNEHLRVLRSLMPGSYVQRVWIS